MTVHLVGAGPGDPDLLTVRAARLLAIADVVVVDRLVDDRVLDAVRREALVIDVGKLAHVGSSRREQDAINDLLIEHARSGARVVRLKGGDPFVFGRGAEEVAALAAAGIDVDVVPGLTSALAVPALAGVPATLRGVASSVTILSGQVADGDEAPWLRLRPSDATVVFVMAVANRHRIATNLVASGFARSTPVAVIERGATPDERRVATTLRDLGALDVSAPAVFVVGDVARLLVERAERPPTPATTAPGAADDQLLEPAR